MAGVPKSVLILSGATATGAGEAHTIRSSKKSFHAYGTTSAGAGAATIEIRVSNHPTMLTYEVAMTLSLTLATTVAAGVHDGGVMDAPWRFTWAHVTAISGTGAAVSVQACNIPGGGV